MLASCVTEMQEMPEASSDFGESLELRNMEGSKVHASDSRKIAVKYREHTIILYRLHFISYKSSDGA